MKDKDFTELCAEMIELVNNKLLTHTKNESHTLKIVKIGVGPATAFGQVTPMPVPGHGAIVATLKPTLRWTRAPDATRYAVAFGEADSLKAASEVTGQTFDPGQLKPGTDYYWRVDRATSKGTMKGDIWRFRTRSKK